MPEYFIIVINKSVNAILEVYLQRECHLQLIDQNHQTLSDCLLLALDFTL